MDQAETRDSTPPTNTSLLSEVAHGLFELEGPLLRIRDLLIATTMMAASAELTNEARNGLDAIADTMLDQIQEVLEERNRLWTLAGNLKVAEQ